jgi:hypothetical protein
MGNQMLGFALAVGADFLRFLAGAADLACKAFTSSSFC